MSHPQATGSNVIPFRADAGPEPWLAIAQLAEHRLKGLGRKITPLRSVSSADGMQNHG